MRIYHMLDYKPNKEPAFPVETSLEEAMKFNTERFKHGVFYTINEYAGSRKKENITRIVAAFCDIDDGTKAQQLEIIRKGPVPSFINETKRGYQIGFFLRDGSRPTWYPLMRDRIIPFYRGDKNACDPTRLLRAPNTTHWKDPLAPFKTAELWYNSNVVYSVDYLLKFFPDAHFESKAALNRDRRQRQNLASDSFWEALYYFDHEEILTRFSGHPSVNNEVFTFKRASRGHLNIYANGKPTPCFIDSEKRIGVGGPTIFQYLRWEGYGNSATQALTVMRELIPELPWNTLNT